MSFARIQERVMRCGQLLFCCAMMFSTTAFAIGATEAPDATTPTVRGGNDKGYVGEIESDKGRRSDLRIQLAQYRTQQQQQLLLQQQEQQRQAQQKQEQQRQQQLILQQQQQRAQSQKSAQPKAIPPNIQRGAETLRQQLVAKGVPQADIDKTVRAYYQGMGVNSPTQLNTSSPRSLLYQSVQPPAPAPTQTQPLTATAPKATTSTSTSQTVPQNIQKGAETLRQQLLAKGVPQSDIDTTLKHYYQGMGVNPPAQSNTSAARSGLYQSVQPSVSMAPAKSSQPVSTPQPGSLPSGLNPNATYYQSGTGAQLTADQVRTGSFPPGTVFFESGTGRQIPAASVARTTPPSSTPSAAAKSSAISATTSGSNVQPTANTIQTPSSNTSKLDLSLVSSPLGPGSSGADVTTLQKWLISNGYKIPSGATGNYGPETQEAVTAWQKAAGLDVQGNYGYFGNLSRSYLSNAYSSNPAATNVTGATSAPSASVPLSTLPVTGLYPPESSARIVVPPLPPGPQDRLPQYPLPGWQDRLPQYAYGPNNPAPRNPLGPDGTATVWLFTRKPESDFSASMGSR